MEDGAKMNKPVHILRYGTVAEKAQLERAINAYDYLAINGNSAAYVSRAIAKFIVEKFFNNTEKGFFIDPITYAFQKNIHLLKNKPKNGEPTLKKSIQKLIGSYQEPANKVYEDTPIQPCDFTNKTLFNGFCTRILDFQYSIISTYINDNDLKKYLQYATGNVDGLLQQFHPRLLIAPYFYLNPNDIDFESWLKINEDFINESIVQSKTQYNDTPVFAQIVINKDILHNKSTIDSVVNGYRNCKCNGFTVWVDGFNEHKENRETLEGFIYFLQSLKLTYGRKQIFNMYGGFFSILLTHPSIRLLNGVSHGMEYGEYRDVYPVGGGLPVSKYYYMPLHQRKDFTDAFYLLEYNHILDTSLKNWGSTGKYFDEICKCEQCRKIMDDEMVNFIKFESDQFYKIVNKKTQTITRRKKASYETKENCLFHYLLCKKMEFSLQSRKSIQDLLDGLKVEKEKYSKSTFLDNDELDYIDNWYDVIMPLARGRNA